MSTTVSNGRRLGRGALIGSFDVELPSGLKINDCKLFEKDGRRWIKLPDRSYVGKDGSTKYTPVVEFATKEANEIFQAAVLPFVDKALGK